MSNALSLSERFAEAKERIEKGIFFTQIGLCASSFAGGAALVSSPGGPTLGEIIFDAAMLIPAGSTLAYGAVTLSIGTYQHFSAKRSESHQHAQPNAPAL